MILLVDNYDSFSYNLYQLIGEIEPNIKVIRNDEMTVDEIKELNPDRIILSPGPGRPENAGIIIEAVKTLGQTIPILGVCLGHQAICAAFGATVTYCLLYTSLALTYTFFFTKHCYNYSKSLFHSKPPKQHTGL